MTATALPDAGAATAATLCAHCGLRVPAGLVEPGAERQFCCTGCSLAWTIIHEVGLDGYYTLAQRREVPVAVSSRSWAEFDHPAFQSLYVRERPDGLSETRLYLENVHCASCVWLVERVPLAIPGVLEAELNIGRSLARIVWDSGRLPLSEVARFLDRIGYRPHPFRGVKADEVRRAEDRAAIARIGVAAALAANLMTVAFAMYAGWFGSMDPEFERFFRWISLGLVTPAMIWPGRVFFRGAWAALRTRTLHMDLPIAVALGAGFVRGAINTVTNTGPVYFDGLAILIFLLLVGRFLQQRAQRAALDSAELLYALSPSSARVVEADGVRDIPTEALLPGMVLEVRAADTIPADGVVVEGDSSVDVALLTGESRPVAVGAGSEVFAGSLNVSSLFRLRVERAGEETRIGRMLREVAEGARRRAPVVKLADRMAGWFVATVLVLATITWVLWAERGSVAVDNAIALLIVTCPCALAMATPLAITVAVGRAARRGILIKGGDAIEQLARPGRLVLDKTGTVTEGRTALVRWTGPDEMRPLVLALERHSHHPIAEGFRAAWLGEPAGELVTDIRQTLGGGLEGAVAGSALIVGSPAFVLARAQDPSGLAGATDPRYTPVLVARGGEVVGAAWFGDPLRPEAAEALASLRADDWTLELLSGDDPAVVERVGASLGFSPEAVRGGATPEAKLGRIAELVATSRLTVVMVGDGVNDAAAMASAHVGVGMHGGAEACLATADVYLSRPGLSALVDLVGGARRTLRVIRRNMAISIGYNVVGVALAMSGHLTPLVAAILMPISSATVILGSWRSRTFDGAET
jgi:Cu2+-exporting ATPase